MALRRIKEERNEMLKFHEENKKRINKDVYAQLGMMGGIALTLIGGILTAATSGIFPLVLSCVGFVGGLTGYGFHMGLERADRKAVKKLHEKYPDLVEKPTLMSDYAMIYSRKVLDHIDNLEFAATQEQIQQEAKDTENALVNSTEHQIDMAMQKISSSQIKEDESGLEI